jgi:MerR family transcriptional regulator, light-induced transcriptional regulator
MLTALRDRYLTAQLAGDRREAIRLLMEDGIRKGLSIRELQLTIIQEAQREIGRMWQENRISVAQEHMATAISIMALAHLYDQAERDRANGKKVVVACVDGELHDFPARLVADALDLAGFDVRFLGASVPIDSLLRLLIAERPDVLALSTTMTFNIPNLRKSVHAVRSAHPELPILVGGGALGQDLIAELGVAGSGKDAEETLTTVRKLAGVTA